MKKILLFFILIVFSCSEVNTLDLENANDPDYIVLEVSNQNVYKIFQNGRIEKIDLEMDNSGWGKLYTGSNTSLFSIANNKLAYLKNENLWLFDFNDNSDLNITKLPDYDKNVFKMSHIYISGYSTNQNQILYYIHSGNEIEPGRNREIDFGFYVYDIAKQTGTMIQNLDNFIEWYNEDEIIFSANYGSKKLKKLNIRNNKESAFFESNYNLNQINFHPNKNKFLAISKSNVVECDIEKQETKTLFIGNGFGSILWPKYSMSGKNVCYIKRERINDNYYYYYLVNGEVVFDSNKYYRLHWFNDRIIIAYRNDEMKIYNVYTKSLLKLYSF